MNYFPTEKLSWREPSSFSYKTMPNSWIGLTFPLIVIGASILLKNIPWEATLFLAVIFGVIGISPLIRQYWPTAIPLTGFPIRLFEDRIVRQVGKIPRTVLFKDISECRISTEHSKNQSYFILALFSDAENYPESVSGLLMETAVSDSNTLDEIVKCFASNKIKVNSTSQP